MKMFSYKKIKLGDFTAHQFTVLEFKSLCSIIFYYFKGNGWQDRYHTHAFNSVSFKLFGSYKERIKMLLGYRESTRKSIIKFFPKTSYHCLGNSKGCLTVLFSGPWEYTWKEFKAGKERTLTWGRREEKDRLGEYVR